MTTLRIALPLVLALGFAPITAHAQDKAIATINGQAITDGDVKRAESEMGPELAVVLKGVALRAGNMDHLSALQYELSVTHDLTQRGLFKDRIKTGNQRLKAGTSKAIERLSRSA